MQSSKLTFFGRYLVCSSYENFNQTYFHYSCLSHNKLLTRKFQREKGHSCLSLNLASVTVIIKPIPLIQSTRKFTSLLFFFSVAFQPDCLRWIISGFLGTLLQTLNNMEHVVNKAIFHRCLFVTQVSQSSMINLLWCGLAIFTCLLLGEIL